MQQILVKVLNLDKDPNELKLIIKINDLSM